MRLARWHASRSRNWTGAARSAVQRLKAEQDWHEKFGNRPVKAEEYEDDIAPGIPDGGARGDKGRAPENDERPGMANRSRGIGRGGYRKVHCQRPPLPQIHPEKGEPI